MIRLRQFPRPCVLVLADDAAGVGEPPVGWSVLVTRPIVGGQA